MGKQTADEREWTPMGTCMKGHLRISDDLQHVIALAAGLATGVLVSAAILGYATYVDVERAELLVLWFPGALAGYVTGRLARYYAPLWTLGVAVPLAMYWFLVTADVVSAFDLLSIPLTAMGISLPLCSARHWMRRVSDAAFLAVAVLFILVCLWPLAEGFADYRSFSSDRFPQLIQEIRSTVVAVPDDLVVQATPPSRLFNYGEVAWASLRGGSRNAWHVDGWAEQSLKSFIRVSFYYEPAPSTSRKSITTLDEARDYMRKIGLKENYVRALKPDPFSQNDLVAWYSSDGKGEPILKTIFGDLGELGIDIMMDGRVEIRIGQDI